ncbi:MAG: DUF2461 domain-containing protein [Bacteroidota bacterium]
MITKDYSAFFKELAKNNEKAWFHANKKRYETHVKMPFLALLEQLLDTLIQWDCRMVPDPKKAVFRINRDIRFSKDKSPYNTIMKAGFSPGGRKSELPGYYLGIDADQVHVGGGLFMASPEVLKKVRFSIAENIKGLENLVEDKNFKTTFGPLQGEKSKRLDKSLLAAAEKSDLIYHKQFYVFTKFPLSDFYGSTKLFDEVRKHFELVRPLNHYFDHVFQQQTQ